MIVQPGRQPVYTPSLAYFLYYFAVCVCVVVVVVKWREAFLELEFYWWSQQLFLLHLRGTQEQMCKTKPKVVKQLLVLRILVRVLGSRYIEFRRPCMMCELLLYVMQHINVINNFLSIYNVIGYWLLSILYYLKKSQICNILNFEILLFIYI